MIGHVNSVIHPVFRTGTCQVQSFRIKPEDTAVIQGQTAILKCAVDNMRGELLWTKDGFALGYGRDLGGFPRYSVTGSEAMGENDLMIRSVELSDDATFQCQILPFEDHPGLRASAVLDVLIPPDQPQIEGSSNGSIVKVPYQQESLSMTCLSTNGKPASEIKWYRNDELMNPEEHSIVYTVEVLADKRQNAKSILTFKPREEDNEATFKCETIHKALTRPLETMVMLSVMHPPNEPEITGYTNGQVIQTNHTLKLVCVARGGNPLAQVYWYKNGQGLDFSYDFGGNKAENDLTFLVEPTDNEAVYRCEASNLVTPEPLFAEVKLTVQFPPKKVMISGQEHAKAGETIKLKCETSISNPPAVISWFSRGRLIDSIITSTKPSPKGGFITTSEIEVTLTSNDDQVVYQCNGNNEALGLGAMDTISLKVVYPPGQPTITGYTEGREVTAGQIQSMTCQSMGGNPPATLTWWKGNEQLQAVSTRNFGLVSSQVSFILKPDDNGAEYRCNATNPATAKPLLAKVTLQVNFPPKSLDITVRPKKGRVGEKLTLTCKSASSNPASTVYWVKDGDKLPKGIDKGQVDADFGGKSSVNVLELVPTVEDNGEIYACNAENILIEQAVSDAVTLNILYKPVFPADAAKQYDITEFQQGSINLTASGNPGKLKYTWFRHSQKIIPGSRRRRDIEISHFKQDGGVLEIENITREDTGTYIIMASNTEGSTNHTIVINVQYAAQITRVSQNVLADKDADAKLECVVNANPLDASHITWSRDGYNMSRTQTEFDATGSRSVLIIPSVVKEDSGLFVCVADNGIGESHETSAQLIVKYAPEIDKTPTYGKAAADKGATATLICKAEGAPDVTIKWKRNDVPLDLTGTKYSTESKKPGLVQYESYLLIHNTTKLDYGQYECIATNDLGEDSHMITLDGTSKPDAPFDLQVVEATPTSITLSWKPGFDGGSTQRFQVRYLEVGQLEGHKYADVVPVGATIYTIIGLKPATEYVMDIRAINKLGESGYQPHPLNAKSAMLSEQQADEVPLIIILVVSIIGMILLGLNVLLILFFIRRRRKKLEKDEGSSITNTVEMYNAPTLTDDSKSIATYDRRSFDDYQDDYGKPFDDDDELRRFLGPSAYGTMDAMGPYKGPEYYGPNTNEYSPPPGANKMPPYRDDIYMNDKMAPESVYGQPLPPLPGGYPSSSLPRAPPGGYPDDDDDYTDQLRKMQMSLNGPMLVPSSHTGLDNVDGHPAGPPVPSRNYAPADVPRYTAPPGGTAYGSLPRSQDPLPTSSEDMRGHLV
ncbi:hypothetical protein LSH36_329g02058 [Paralvinella palmiformis]|uniref:Nephrin n=1 Tax=Paralvinella palmiformis TaxID=53620 RepID=A0AAD9JGA9_9ANNE|nr:hypothetical protein LSH36_329g02058 [Paralvinella palmiformis]